MKDTTRRAALRGFVTAGLGVAAVAAASSGASAQEKMDQQTVQYQNQPKDGNKCGMCAHFVAPNQCKLVAGNISPEGWCLLYAPKEG